MRTTIENRMRIGASLFVITFSFSIKANAETCAKVPTCEELGYTGTSCSSGTATLKCPFDQSKVFCAQDCKGFDLDNCPAGASCEQCWNKKYKKLGCADGYINNNGSCEINSCVGYTRTSQDVSHCGGYQECQSGSTKKYRCYTCEAGYVVSKYSGYRIYNTVESCIANPCYLTKGSSADTEGNVTYYDFYEYGARYQLTSKSDPNCKNSDSYDSCQSGSTIYYRCRRCMSGYGDDLYSLYSEPATGKCHTTGDYDCPASKGWQSGSSSFTGAVSTESCTRYFAGYGYKYWYRPTECGDGYHMNYKTFRCDKN